MTSPQSSAVMGSLSHSSAARALGSSAYGEEIDSGSDDEDLHSSGVIHPLEKSSSELDEVNVSINTDTKIQIIGIMIQQRFKCFIPLSLNKPHNY